MYISLNIVISLFFVFETKSLGNTFIDLKKKNTRSKKKKNIYILKEIKNNLNTKMSLRK